MASFCIHLYRRKKEIKKVKKELTQIRNDDRIFFVVKKRRNNLNNWIPKKRLTGSRDGGNILTVALGEKDTRLKKQKSVDTQFKAC